MQRILFVDDEPNVVRSLKRVVRSHNIDAEAHGVRSAVEALEYIEKQPVDLIVADVMMPGMDGIELLTRLKGNPDTQHIPVIMLTAQIDGSVKNVAIELGAVEFVNKPADPDELAARLRNVLRLKTYQNQLVEQNRILAAQVVKAQKMEIAGLLASGIAHDLNNILSSILGKTELALVKLQDQDIQRQLEAVIGATQHAGKMVRQILRLGRTDDTTGGTTEPGVVIDECLELLRVSVPNGISIEWEKPQEASRVGLNATALYQVVMNLAINAVHAMGKTGTLRITLQLEQLGLVEVARYEGVGPGDFVCMTLGDTGPGIDPDIRDRLFEPFFTTKEIGKGTGIGLSVVDRIVRDAGGFVTVESTTGEGTAFSIHMPTAGVPEQQVAPEPQSHG